MNTESKEQAILLVREVNEALELLDIALVPNAQPKEIAEAKNVVTNALRSYKSFFENLPPNEKTEAHNLFVKKIESLVSKAQQLNRA
jgi:hypothetical protein